MSSYSKHHGLINDHPVGFRLGKGAAPYLQSVKRSTRAVQSNAEGYHASLINIRYRRGDKSWILWRACAYGAQLGVRLCPCLPNSEPGTYPDRTGFCAWAYKTRRDRVYAQGWLRPWPCCICVLFSRARPVHLDYPEETEPRLHQTPIEGKHYRSSCPRYRRSCRLILAGTSLIADPMNRLQSDYGIWIDRASRFLQIPLQFTQ